MLAAQSTIDASGLELSCSASEDTNNTTSQCPAIPDQGTISQCPAIPDQSSAANGVNAEDKIKLPARGKGKLPVPPRKRVTLDDINELHFSVLQKENKKLDIEIDNLLLKKREIMLRIQELEARTINPELNFLSS